MKKSLLFLALAFSASLNAQKGDQLLSVWRSNPDEDIRSKTTDFTFLEKAKFYYYISNDNQNIYLDLRFFEQAVQNSVMRSGLTVWINMDGKKSKKTGVIYPVGMRINGSPGGPQGQGAPGNRGGNPPQGNREGMPERGNMNEQGRNRMAPVADLKTVELVGFSETGPVTVSQDDKDNYRGSIHFENDGMWYELVLPIQKLPSANAKDNSAVNLLTFGIEYKNPSFGGPGMGPGGGGFQGGGMSGGGMPGGGMPRGGGGRSGGGMPSGGQGGGMGAPPEPAPIIAWLRDIKLATEK